MSRTIAKWYIFFILLSLSVFIIEGIKIKGSASAIANSLHNIQYYVEQTGRFPSSQSEWICSGYLKPQLDKGHLIYWVKVRHFPDEIERWNRFGQFQDFTFAYGASYENLYLQGDTLKTKNTDAPVYLIKGPYFWLFRPVYWDYSIKLYELMKTQQKDMENDSVRP